jgi:hypothetical protein
MAWAVIGLQAVAVLGCALLGALFAAAVPAVIAIPVVAVATFVWFAYPDSGVQVLLRSLDSREGGTGQTGQPGSAFLLGSGLLDAVVVLGGLALLGSRWWARVGRPGYALGTVVVLAAAFGVGAGAALAAPGTLDLDSTVVRRTPLVCSTEAGLTVCVWPEDRSRAGRIRDAVRTVDAAVRGAGLSGVQIATQHPVPRYPAISVDASASESRAELIASVAAGYVARATTCGGRVARDRWADNPTVPDLVVRLLVGLPVADLRAAWGPTTVSRAQQVLREHPRDLARWFEEHTCRPERGQR